ncbi:hypothetical protein [Streptomyces sp. Isolate_219]|uniref:hypothetical protein n=1 Tax=Streptomyces sp. Isolate_219 TaxID=2950110 RepID=UPI0021C5F5F5|nr:hypothetical protein [Streptomyces sp. Isolate_219]MCR8573886.1 hypothetical protein [Streptomyces sp. Isolate_219]
MSTSTDASTVISEAAPLGEGTTLDERAVNGTAAPVSEGTSVDGAPSVNGAPSANGDASAGVGTAPDERTAAGEGTPSGGNTAAGEGTAVGHATPLDGSAPVDGPPASWLRIEKGHAEPEEIAAISVVLCAQLAGLRALAEDGRPEAQPPGRRHPPRRHACWSGCWTCG